MIDAVVRTLTPLQQFFKTGSAGGIVLMFAAVLAMAAANSSLGGLYDTLLHMHMSIKIGDVGLDYSLHHWINDGLMVVFFLLVGMEIKREVIEGELASVGQAILPAAAAAGGVAVPALIYVFINDGNPEALRGWAIPTATDIAFALGVLALFGKSVPIGLKVFLTAVAVIDDLIAILIIAVFYTEQLHMTPLMLALGLLFALFVCNRFSVQRLWVYVLTGTLLWLAVLQSGIHATLAGVAIGFMIPHDKDDDGKSLLVKLEHSLHPWVAFVILPLFAFANSGVHFDGMTMEALTSPVPLGIALGLFLGKQIGIFTVSVTLIKLGFARLPSGATWKQFFAVCVLCGIGFTMALFIGALSFRTEEMQALTRVGVLSGSLISALWGSALLYLALIKRRAAGEDV